MSYKTNLSFPIEFLDTFLLDRLVSWCERRRRNSRALACILRLSEKEILYFLHFDDINILEG